jgi:hypothetical protein
MTTENSEIVAGDTAPSPPVQITAYTEATEAYLAAATWLEPLDAPFTVQARMIAKSLDRQLTNSGEVQSALASTYTKVLQQLDRRRPAPTAPPTDPAAPSSDGTASIFTVLDD